MTATYDKADVDYSEGHENSRCGLCRYFKRPDACNKVRGHIDPAYWCRLFKRKPKD